MTTTALRVRSDVDIQQDVIDELAWDPVIEDARIGIAVEDGVVTLDGRVESYGEKLAAEIAAFRVDGVRAIVNDIRVHVDGIGVPSDTAIAIAIANAFEWNTAVPEERLHVRVADGRVTLEGDVDWAYQRTAAESIVHNTSGVRAVTSLIEVNAPQASDRDVRRGIERALVRHAEVDAAAVEVHVVGGEVMLSGVVGSWCERQHAEEIAWKSPGASAVTNHLQIRPQRAF